MPVSEQDILLKKYDDLVAKIARGLSRQFKVPKSCHEDMIASGYLALVETTGKYDPKRQDSFKHYLCLRIRGAMIDSLRRSHVLSGRANRFIKAWSAIQLLREEDLIEESAFYHNKRDPLDNLARMLQFVANGAVAFRLSIDEARNELDDIADSEKLADEKLCQAEDIGLLQSLVNKLPEKERIIIQQHYFEDKSFIEIAKENTGMTKSWVSRLHTRALSQLRESLYVPANT